MSSSVGISFPLTINTPSSTGTSSLFPPSQIKQKPREISISLPYPVTSLTELLRDAADKNSLQNTKSIHGIVTKSQFTSKSMTLLLNQMVIAYSKTSDFGSARQVFDEIPHKSVFSWTVLIVGATENGFHRDGFGYFVEMLSCDVSPDEYALSAAAQACTCCVDGVTLCEMVHAQVVTRGFSSLTFVNTSLLSVYAKLGRVGDSRKVFSSMESRNEVSWNAMISGFASNGLYSEAYVSFSRMLEEGIRPNVPGVNLPWNALLSGYTSSREGEEAVLLFLRMCRNDVERDVEEANQISWTTLVTAYSQSSEWEEEALSVFSQMRETGFQPNQITFSAVLASCASLCFLEYGQQVHSLTYKTGFATDKCVESALIDMYAKCGSVRDAIKVFESLKDPDVVSWTAMISGYAQHGMAKDALGLFRKMEELVFPKPNSVTFLCLLFACSHGGLVDEGLRCFHLMEDKYGLVPEIEHYACVVDILGRVGRLSEAWEFIMKMPMEPDEKVWSTLLGACRVHGDIQLAEIAAQKVIGYNPEDSAALVLLSNAYREAGNIEAELSVRNVMNSQAMRKEPGLSWITIGGQIHKFCSGDHHHPQKDDIYRVLNDLMEKIKSKKH
ncbi:hypothetical protein HID58_011996 [Brassica napus]|uniref:Pentatricopeptide repeat-containing protein n=1 Tax=Brassica napus TaxID=3708 RepID=A0ABQ8DZT8_BRANA|nr:hypothetical protein HID58_011996 [Brassica napus]